MSTFLKIKIMSLAAEARIIRHEETRLVAKARLLDAAQKPDSWRRRRAAELHLHRVHNVRSEARSAHLAYGFLRGTPYASIEAKAKVKPDWKHIARMAGRFGVLVPADFAAWSGEKAEPAAKAA